MCYTYMHIRKESREKKKFAAVVDTIQNCIPCLHCKDHILDYSMRHSLHVISDDLATWVRGLHNAVNVRMGKTPFSFIDEFNWCSSYISLLLSEEDTLQTATRMWNGVTFILASLATSHAWITSHDRLMQMYEICELCEYTYPCSQCRLAFRTAGLNFYDLLKLDNSNGWNS